MEVADQRIAAPARPDLGKGDGAEHPDGDVPAGRVVLAVGMMEREPGGRDRERAARGNALFVDGIARRPAPDGPLRFPVALAMNIRRDQFRREREQRVRLQPPRMGARRRERAFERPAEGAERGLGRRTRTPRQAVTNTL